MSVTEWHFGTPIFQCEVHDAAVLNNALRPHILELERMHPSQRLSNRGGWQSEQDLQSSENVAVQTLFHNVRMVVKGFTSPEQAETAQVDFNFVAWANINRRDDYNRVHHHHRGFWSGVYYVAVPPPEGDRVGAIVFRNPTAHSILASTISAPAALKRQFRHQLEILPRAGLLLIFPSWLEHFVDPHDSDQERISVAFDVIYKNHQA
jgi:uncharacterized protein (TIGR02466 family)